MTDELTVLDLQQACAYLELEPDEFATLEAHRLIAPLKYEGQRSFPKTALDLTKHLLILGRTYGWGPDTLGWYADLVFASQVGRTILLPIAGKKELTLLAESWLATPYVAAVLHDVDDVLNETDGPLIPLLQSLTTIAVGEGRFWADQGHLAQSALYPLIVHFETQGIPILDQNDSIGRDAAPIFALMLIAFTSIAPPLSQDLADLLNVGSPGTELEFAL